jgi:7-keto-8-aminopelargonate synthetase-like enzyme
LSRPHPLAGLGRTDTGCRGPRLPPRPPRRPPSPPRPRWNGCAQGHPLLDAVIDEIDGRRIRIGRHWLVDFASCNYLGFDLDPEIHDAIDGTVRRWGTHPSWSRLLGSPRLYEQIETELTELLSAPDTLVLPTITHIHNSVIPLLAAQGSVFLDARAHKTIYAGATLARANGAQLRRFPTGNADHVEAQLKEAPAERPRLICMDGVNSMTGNIPDLPTFARLARRYDAALRRRRPRLRRDRRTVNSRTDAVRRPR